MLQNAEVSKTINNTDGTRTSMDVEEYPLHENPEKSIFIVRERVSGNKDSLKSAPEGKGWTREDWGDSSVEYSRRYATEINPIAADASTISALKNLLGQ